MNELNSKDDKGRLDEDKRWAAAHRRGNLLMWSCIFLAAVILGLAWRVYPMLEAHDASLQKLPSLTQRVNQTMDSINRWKEAKAADSSRERELRDRVTDLGRDLRARIEASGKRASQSAEEAYRRLEAEMRTRTGRLAASTEGDQAQIAELQQELNQMRARTNELAVQQADDLAQISRQMDEIRSGESQQLAALTRDVDGDRRNIDAVSDQLAVRKIPFEASKEHNRDLADGITLHIDSTNPTYRQVSGWMWVAGDHRSIWLRDRSAQEPVIFYGNQDGEKRELVFTNVTQNSVTGYLLLPKQASGPEARAETEPGGE